jgi:hypothetical protein
MKDMKASIFLIRILTTLSLSAGIPAQQNNNANQAGVIEIHEAAATTSA